MAVFSVSLVIKETEMNIQWNVMPYNRDDQTYNNIK